MIIMVKKIFSFWYRLMMEDLKLQCWKIETKSMIMIKTKIKKWYILQQINFLMQEIKIKTKWELIQQDSLGIL